MFIFCMNPTKYNKKISNISASVPSNISASNISIIRNMFIFLYMFNLSCTLCGS
jgi:hypothetical protein